MASSFRDLRVWQEAMTLTAQVYRSTAEFPKNETYRLAQQIRRAAVSVPSNIAEGKGHRSDKEFVHFLYYARGSLFELETQLLLSHQLEYISAAQSDEAKQSIVPVARSLTGLINSLDQLAAA